MGKFKAGPDSVNRAAGWIARELAVTFGESPPPPERIGPVDQAQRERAIENSFAVEKHWSRRYHARLEAIKETSHLVTASYCDMHLTCMVCGGEMVARRKTK